MRMEIKKLPEEVKNSLRSGFQITNVVQCVNELVFNSLDAKSTKVAVRINMKMFRIQVVDNGDGITKNNLELLAERYMTSKCRTVEDYKKTTTYGYKGESLASIRNNCKKMIVSTRCPPDEGTYTKTLEGDITNDTILTKHRPSQGTTITVEGFLYNLPVRQKSIDCDMELNRVKKNLELLSIIQPNISFTLRNEEKKLMLLITNTADTVEKALISAYPDLEQNYLYSVKVKSCEKISISALVSTRKFEGAQVQLLYVNKRPVTCSRINNFIDEIFQSTINSGIGNFVYVVNIKCPYSNVNVAPSSFSKYTVEFKNWAVVLRYIEKMLKKFLQSHNLLPTNTSTKKTDIEEKSIFRNINGACQAKATKRKLGISLSVQENVPDMPEKKIKVSMMKDKNAKSNKKTKVNMENTQNKLRKTATKNNANGRKTKARVSGISKATAGVDNIGIDNHIGNYLLKRTSALRATAIKNETDQDMNNVIHCNKERVVLKNVRSHIQKNKSTLRNSMLNNQEIINQAHCKLQQERIENNFICGTNSSEVVRCYTNKMRIFEDVNNQNVGKAIIMDKFLKSTDKQWNTQSEPFDRKTAISVSVKIKRRCMKSNENISVFNFECQTNFYNDSFHCNQIFNKNAFNITIPRERQFNLDLLNSADQNIYKNFDSKISTPPKYCKNKEMDFNFVTRNNKKISKTYFQFMQPSNTNFVGIFPRVQNRMGNLEQFNPKEITQSQSSGSYLIQMNNFRNYIQSTQLLNNSLVNIEVKQNVTITQNRSLFFTECNKSRFSMNYFDNRDNNMENIRNWVKNCKAYNSTIQQTYTSHTYKNYYKNNRKHYLQNENNSAKRKFPKTVINVLEDIVIRPNLQNYTKNNFIQHRYKNGNLVQNKILQDTSCSILKPLPKRNVFKSPLTPTKFQKVKSILKKNRHKKSKNEVRNPDNFYNNNVAHKEGTKINNENSIESFGKFKFPQLHLNYGSVQLCNASKIYSTEKPTTTSEQMKQINKGWPQEVFKLPFIPKTVNRKNKYLFSDLKIKRCNFDDRPVYKTDCGINPLNVNEPMSPFKYDGSVFSINGSSRNLRKNTKVFRTEMAIKKKKKQLLPVLNLLTKQYPLDNFNELITSDPPVGYEPHNYVISEFNIDTSNYITPFKNTDSPDYSKPFSNFNISNIELTKVTKKPDSIMNLSGQNSLLDKQIPRQSNYHTTLNHSILNMQTQFEAMTSPKGTIQEIDKRNSYSDLIIPATYNTLLESFKEDDIFIDLNISQDNLNKHCNELNDLVFKDFPIHDADEKCKNRKQVTDCDDVFNFNFANSPIPANDNSSLDLFISAAKSTNKVDNTKCKPMKYVEDNISHSSLANTSFTLVSKANKRKANLVPAFNNSIFYNKQEHSGLKSPPANVFKCSKDLNAENKCEQINLPKGDELINSVLKEMSVITPENAEINMKTESNLNKHIFSTPIRKKSRNDGINNNGYRSKIVKQHIYLKSPPAKCKPMEYVKDNISHSSLIDTSFTLVSKANKRKADLAPAFNNSIFYNKQEHSGLKSPSANVFKCLKDLNAENKCEQINLPKGDEFIDSVLKEMSVITPENAEIDMKAESNLNKNNLTNPIRKKSRNDGINNNGHRSKILKQHNYLKSKEKEAILQKWRNNKHSTLTDNILKLEDKEHTFISKGESQRYMESTVSKQNCASNTLLKNVEQVEVGLMEQTTKSSPNEWIRQDNTSGCKLYVNLRTGMIRANSPKEKTFNMKSRISFVPKGLSPVLSSRQIVHSPITASTKVQLCKAIAATYEEELGIIKWKNIVKNQDLKSFFNETFSKLSKKTAAVPDVSKRVQQKILAKSREGLHSYNFTKKIFEDVTVIGQMDKKFIVGLFKRKSLILLFDQHAVHERIRLEKLTKEYTLDNASGLKMYKCQRIDQELKLQLSKEQIEILSTYKQRFRKLGLSYRCNKDHVEIVGVPYCFSKKRSNDKKLEKLKNLLISLIEEETDNIHTIKGLPSNTPRTIQNVINSEACRGSIMFGDELSTEDCRKLLRKLTVCKLPFQCAHGRPTTTPLIQLRTLDYEVPRPHLERLRTKYA